MRQPPPCARLMCQRCLAAVLCAVGALLGGTLATQAATDTAALCQQAAERAARNSGVPLDVLLAITLVETGRSMGGQIQPWPWAVHADARGHWPTSRHTAMTLVKDALARGQRNIDIGCFQINYHWHGDQFASLDAMFDPATNADYAARLLRGHYLRLGSWDAAAGAYHSLTPHLAQRYAARFASMRQIAPQTASPQPAPPRPETRFALFQPGTGSAPGAIVPQSALAGARPLLDLARPNTALAGVR